MNVDQHIDRSINALIRQLQPTAVINDRGFDEGDFGTPERDYTKEGTLALSFAKRTEACQSIGMESWGWRNSEDYYTDRHLFRSIARYLARDANYLLNVGPLPDGTLPAEALGFLKRTGAWYRAVRESLDGATPASHLTANRDVLLTRRGHHLYVILHADPKGDAVKLKPLALLPRRATLLNTGATIACSLDLVPSEHGDQGRYLRLTKLPVNAHANTVLVAKLEFDYLPAVLGPTQDSGASIL
jgi:alpha-L-fucosidase